MSIPKYFDRSHVLWGGYHPIIVPLDSGPFSEGTPVTGPRPLLGLPQDGVPSPSQNWMGYPPPARTGWGIPWPGLDWVPPQPGQDGVLRGQVRMGYPSPSQPRQDMLGQVMPWAVCLLRFPTGGLSC